MNKLAETSVRRMIAEGLSFDPVEDFADLTRLDRLGAATTGTDKRDPRYKAALQPELHLGGLVFHRLSIGARAFWQECAEPWLREREDLGNIAMAWLLANARRPEEIWRLQSAGAEAFAATIASWRRGIALSEAELFDPLAEWLGVSDESKPAEAEEAPSDLSDALAELAVAHGKPDLGWWIWEASESEVALLWEKHLERKAAEAGVPPGQDPDSRFSRALKAFREAEAELREKLKGRNAQRPTSNAQRSSTDSDAAGGPADAKCLGSGHALAGKVVGDQRGGVQGGEAVHP